MEKFETITGTGSAITRTCQNDSYITVIAVETFFGAASFVFSLFWISNHDVMQKIIITRICRESWEPCTISLSHVQLKTIPCNMCKGKFCVKKLSFFYLQKNKTDSKNREEKAMSQWESWRAIDRQPDLIISHHRPREKPDSGLGATVQWKVRVNIEKWKWG